jgi:hypothetical protein
VVAEIAEIVEITGAFHAAGKALERRVRKGVHAVAGDLALNGGRRQLDA